ncbi:MAG: hypothetical protein KTR28_01985 [Micavibrio sp.]|nr:hypothetical protein [Micavibrio sp.]
MTDIANQKTPEAPPFCQHRAADLAKLVEELESKIESVYFGDELIHAFNLSAADIPKNPHNFQAIYLAFSISFVNDQSLKEDQRISGLPGNLILLDHFVKKALGQNVSASTLLNDFKAHNMERTHETCKSIDKRASEIIKKSIKLKDQPVLSQKPPTPQT